MISDDLGCIVCIVLDDYIMHRTSHVSRSSKVSQGHRRSLTMHDRFRRRSFPRQFTMCNPIPGGGLFAPRPSGFSCAIAKRRKTESSYLVTFSKHSLRTFLQKSYWVKSGQVTRGDLLTQPKKSYNHARARIFHGSISSLEIS